MTNNLWKFVRRQGGLLALFLLLVLPGCRVDQSELEHRGTAVAITGYNYTIEGIQEFYVDGAWGGGVSIGAGTGGVCCVSVPDKWRPGLSVKVSWRRSDCRGDKKQRCPERMEDLDKWPMLQMEKIIPVEPYERPNDIQVMFLPNDEIKVYVFDADPIHPSHPSKLGKPRPLDHPEWKSPYE